MPMNKEPNPRISIITCTLNSANYIQKNVSSVKNQNYQNLEHILIDGYSQDGTYEELLRSAKKDRRLKLYRFPARGVSNAFNKGISKCSGKYILFLNSDDYLYGKNVISSVVRFLNKNKDLDWIYGKISVIETDGKRVGVFPKRKIFQISNRTILKYKNYIPHQAVFIKKEVFQKYGPFDKSLKINMDTEYWLRISKVTKWRFFDRIVSNYTLREDALSTSKKLRGQNLKYLEIAQSKHLSFIERNVAKIVNRIIDSFNKMYR